MYLFYYCAISITAAFIFFVCIFQDFGKFTFLLYSPFSSLIYFFLKMYFPLKFYWSLIDLQYSIPFMLIQNVDCWYNPKGTHD